VQRMQSVQFSEVRDKTEVRETTGEPPRIRNQQVAGSSPAAGSSSFNYFRSDSRSATGSCAEACAIEEG
jgi:hypothetical protein